MKKLMFALLITSMVAVFLVGCGGSPYGRYNNEYKDGEYIDLKENGSFTVKLDKAAYKGTFTIAGDRINFKMSDGTKDNAKLKGSVITDSDGNSWVKQ